MSLAIYLRIKDARGTITMQHTFVNIETPIGYIGSGRDAIYLNSFEQIFNSIVMKGKINSIA